MNAIRRLTGHAGAASLVGVVCVWALSAALVPVAAAQRPFELTPTVGVLVPLSNVMSQNNAEVKQQPSLAVGVRASLPSAGRMSIEGVLAVASGTAKATQGSSEAEAEGRLLLASVRAVWALGAPAAAGMSWHATTGVGLVSRGSDAYDFLDGTTDIGAVLGVGMRTRVGTRWTLRADIEDHISSAEFEGGGASSGSQLQNDVMISLGLVFPFGNR
jgi:hypothetical protein